jgi:iron complex outermembrane recepter protein
MALTVLLFLPGLAASEEPRNDQDLMDMSLDQLMDVKVTTASKKEQRISDVSAALYVLTSEDLRRSGATSLPEALRLVPGIHVARIDASKWAISSRGFNDRFANKMLVLVDGRSTYSHLFSGVFWETQDIPFEDIERIEVIRGPGATVWGANAVNGVINIITKSAEETQGVQLGCGGGTSDQGLVNARYGTRLGQASWLRMDAGFSGRRNGWVAPGRTAHDNWSIGRLGFRVDTRHGTDDAIQVSGNAFSSRYSNMTVMPQLNAPYSATVLSTDPFSGASILGRWTRRYSAGNELSVQSYWDHTKYDVRSFLSQQYDILDAEAVNRLRLGSRQEFVAGLELRSISDRVVHSGSSVVLDPAYLRTHLLSAFLEDEVSFLDRRLTTTVGSKFEYCQASGWEIQPNVRFLVHPAEKHTLWAAMSRAVRTPSRVDESMRYTLAVYPPNTFGPGTPPVIVQVRGNKDVKSENLVALDAGYRCQPSDHFAVDLATFLNRYDHLRNSRIEAPEMSMVDGSPYMVLPYMLANGIKGKTYGGEVTLDYRPQRTLRLSGTYAYLFMKMDNPPVGDLTQTVVEDGSDPAHKVVIRGSYDLTPRIETDLAVRYVGKMANGKVPSYAVADLRGEYRWLPTLSTWISVNNLFSAHHMEFTSEALATPSTEVPVGVTAGIRWNW